MTDVIKEIEENFNYHYERARTFLREGDLISSREEIELALEIKPGDDRSLHLLGIIYFKIADYDKAIKIFKQLLRRNPDVNTLRVNLGLSYLKMGEYESAVDVLKEAVSRDDSNEKAHNYLGYALYNLGRTEEALNEFKKGRAHKMVKRIEEEKSISTPIEGDEINGEVEEFPRSEDQENEKGPLQDERVAPEEGVENRVEELPPADTPLETEQQEKLDKGETRENKGEEVEEPETISDFTPLSDKIVKEKQAIEEESEGEKKEEKPEASEEERIEEREEEKQEDLEKEVLEGKGGGEKEREVEKVEEDTSTMEKQKLKKEEIEEKAKLEEEEKKELEEEVTEEKEAEKKEELKEEVKETERQPSKESVSEEEASAETLKEKGEREIVEDFSKVKIEKIHRVKGENLHIYLNDNVFYIRTKNLLLMKGKVELERAKKRYKGKDLELNFGTEGNPISRIKGKGNVTIELGRFRNPYLIEIRGKELFIREDFLFAFNETLDWENGRIMGEGLQIDMVLFKKYGYALLGLESELVNKIENDDPEEPVIIPIAKVIGWQGKFKPLILKEGNENFISLKGSGLIYLKR